MSQNHLLLMDPLEKLNFKLDSSLKLGFELSRLDHKIYTATPKDLYWDIEDESASAHVSLLDLSGGPAEVKVLEQETLQLSAFHGIHMRKEPPMNLDYIAITWMLDSLGEETKIFNSPNALRQLNEKLSIFWFPEYTDKAYLGSKPEELLSKTKEFGGDVIVKPLDLYGGKGIFRLNLESESEASGLGKLEEACQSGMRLIQPFNSAIYDGEIRAFALAGKPLAWCLKKPAEGSFFANTSAGAKLESFEPSSDILEMVTDVSEALFDLGITMVGYDIIGNVISEINVTSPRLLQGPDDTTNYYEYMAKWFHNECKRV